MQCPKGCGELIPGGSHDDNDGLGGVYVVHNLSCPVCERFVLDYELVYREEETPKLRQSKPVNEDYPGKPRVLGAER